MTTKVTRPSDVFLSSAPVDEATTSSVRRELEKAGLIVFADEGEQPDEPLSDAARIGIQESTAFVAVITPTHLRSDRLMLEVGAAWVWATPIYLLLSEVRTDELPTYLGNYPSFPLRTGVARVVEEVRRQAKPLTEEHRQILTAVYQEVGVPVDRLISEPVANADLTIRFTSQSGQRLEPTRLVRELLRLRKVGKLPRLAIHGTA